MKNFPRFALSLALVFALLSGCAPKASPVSLTFYKRGYIEGGSDSISVSIAKAVQAFESAHPNIRVTVVGVAYDEQGDTALRAALAQGKVNVLSINTYELPEFARAGYLSPIDAFLSDADRADFYENALTAASLDGKIYAWPLWVTAVAMYANPAIFAERGVAIPTLENPWTWADFMQAAQQLTFTRADGAPVYAFSASSLPDQVVYLPFFYVDGGRILSPDGRRFTQNSPEAISALEKLQQLKAQRTAAPDFGSVDQATVRAQFEAGKLAMVMDTPSFIPDMQAKRVEFVAFPPPGGETGKIVTSGAFGMYGVAAVADAETLSAAHLFANYLTSSQVARDVPGYQLAPGLRRSNSIYASDAPRAVISKLVGYGVYEPPVNISAELRQRYELALQAIALGDASPQAAMDSLAADYQAELDALAP
ncbi:MAG: ABC transporter substrate-binding protein [Anaerolineales bacterium]